ncbi:UDP-N-acetylglucosamine 2-epimerase (non-hydrolyzing) [candidate division KSB1 bacterium]|nr:UDP-N-acetylglucosamine 2-epimerase (non-hydrolyzing) [candidate division KSB1 bacterium]
MKKILTIVGARPQFIKAAAVSRVLRRQHQEYLLHTGQHYDENMSKLFFDEMNIPIPDLNLEIGSGPHGEQTGKMLVGIERVLQGEKPDMVMVYGDTNSTLAGALAAAKLHIQVAHVEAGLRSFNRAMPEEINRIVADQIAELLFCPTETAVGNLRREGISRGVHNSGDVMYDAALYFAGVAAQKSAIMQQLALKDKEYILVTCHRAQNTDDVANLTAIVEALVACDEPVVFPVHPRTRGFINSSGLTDKLAGAKRVRLIDPVGYLDMIQLEKHAAKIVTDSGGVQKEAYFYTVPCITLRDETEWIETVDDGWNVLVGADKERIVDAIVNFAPAGSQNNHYGDGHAGEKIVDILTRVWA